MASRSIGRSSLDLLSIGRSSMDLRSITNARTRSGLNG